MVRFSSLCSINKKFHTPRPCGIFALSTDIFRPGKTARLTRAVLLNSIVNATQLCLLIILKLNSVVEKRLTFEIKGLCFPAHPMFCHFSVSNQFITRHPHFPNRKIRKSLLISASADWSTYDQTTKIHFPPDGRIFSRRGRIKKCHPLTHSHFLHTRSHPTLHRKIQTTATNDSVRHPLPKPERLLSFPPHRSTQKRN